MWLHCNPWRIPNGMRVLTLDGSWRTRCTSMVSSWRLFFSWLQRFYRVNVLLPNHHQNASGGIWKQIGPQQIMVSSYFIICHVSSLCRPVFSHEDTDHPEILQLVCTRQMLQRLPLLRRHLRSVTVEHEWLTMMVEWVMWFTDTCW